MTVLERGAVQREAFRNGAAHPVTIKVGSRPGPRGFLRSTIEIDGPFGEVRAEHDDLFGALQLARRQFEPDGWLLAVEGSRLGSHPSGMQREQAGGRVLYRLDEQEGDGGPHPTLGILDPADVSECGSVVEQERWYEGWIDRPPLRPVVVRGRGWRMLVPDLGNGRVVQQPILHGQLLVRPGSADGDVAVVYSDRISALAAGTEEPRPIQLDRARIDFPGGLEIDPGGPWASSSIPVAPRRLPRMRLGAETPDPRITEIVPGARVLQNDDASSLLVILRAGSELDIEAASLADAMGAALIPPIVLVVDGTEPLAVRRALKGLL